LERAFPDDPDAHAVVEEALGLSMNEDRSFQKGMMLVGEPRSGKGTILAVLEGLLGSGNCIGVDLNKWMEGENSRAGLISKRAIVFADVRLKPEKRYGTNLDPGGLDHKSIALLLHIIAGDTVSINVKWQVQPWQGRLPGLVWLASNKVPNFNDLVLPTRFIKLSFKESYLGREDNQLVEKLLVELPGIAARCVRAYGRLRERGRFIQPASSNQLEIDIRKTSDPFTQFVLDTFEPDPKGEVNIGKAYTHFLIWCQEQGHVDLPKSIKHNNMKTFLRKIPGFEQVRTHRQHAIPRVWLNIRFRKAEEQS
jgi:putative DNA primase/helicase